MLDRRDFLRVATSAGIGIATAGCRAGSGYDARSLAYPELLGSLGTGVVRSIGARYRQMNRAEDNPDALRNAILAARPWTARLFAASPPLPTLVRDDFAQGRTVVVDGWILSTTEARQCALFSLETA